MAVVSLENTGNCEKTAKSCLGGDQPHAEETLEGQAETSISVGFPKRHQVSIL